MPLYTHSLRRIVKELARDHGRIPRIFRFILDAIQHAHQSGVVHRDINPNNVLMNSDDDVVVSDFGLGRRLDTTSTRLTTTNAAMGTSGYMAPEQCHNANTLTIAATSNLFNSQAHRI